MTIRTTEPLVPASALRSLGLGDAWQYVVSGAMVPPGGEPLAISGSIAVSVLPDAGSDRPGAFMLQFLQRLEVQDRAGMLQTLPAPDWMFSVVQDAVTQDTSIVADNMGPGGAWRRAKAAQVFYPGHWTSETRYANQLEFGDGDFVRNTLVVTGRERVETPAGVFSAWVAAITSDSPAMGRITGIDWWTPELGAPARFETNVALPDGTRTCLRATLSSTNIVLDQPGSIVRRAR